ncbi:lipopolysaccharide transport system ATP-binding protein [Chryseobacterium defluvii]|uniref:Lipopolysaccharide transport system ATP-binding protein n=1 Tax=Chryseobacterium defluvii TaxID=160396 RepID=A0A840KGG9_9FLAO|nr:ABC transporter ATP-binding protein [Chryseobacterium defluvii]MBB4806600.1 lipopolysaccharide transport system ATP-binding protein [Chryseobacterium defluvii]
MSEVLIKVENVSKKFCKQLNRGLWYGVQDLATGIVGNSKERDLRKAEFWAVNDISFELKRGECLGLLGHNGAGKSTLLKVLNGLIMPDRGRVEMRGRVNALIELGAGFNPILTGRENIYNNAAVLGLSKAQTNNKLDEIIAFSELEEFIDTPVQYYSSGMKVRLGFSVAAHLEPDILILDEVLAVGDAGFKIKSFNKMMELMKTAAVLFVSHSMPNVARVCNKVIFMQHGKELYFGEDIHKGIEMYFDEFSGESSMIENDKGASISNFKINSKPADKIESKDNIVQVKYGDDLVVECEIEIKDPTVQEYYILMSITDKDLKIVANFITNKFSPTFKVKDKNHIKMVFPEMLLIDGEYSITYFVMSNNGNENQYTYLANYRNYTKFKVTGLKENVYASIFLKGDVYQNGELLVK